MCETLDPVQTGSVLHLSPRQLLYCFLPTQKSSDQLLARSDRLHKVSASVQRDVTNDSVVFNDVFLQPDLSFNIMSVIHDAI